MDSVEGHIVIEDQDGGGFGLPVQQGVQRFLGAGGGEVGAHDEGFFHGQFVFFEGFVVAGQPFIFDAEGGGPAYNRWSCVLS